MTVDEFKEIFEQPNFAIDFCKDYIYQMSRSLYELYTIISKYGKDDTIVKLLKMSFDIFGLIPDGLAIDKTTLTK